MPARKRAPYTPKVDRSQYLLDMQGKQKQIDDLVARVTLLEKLVILQGDFPVDTALTKRDFPFAMPGKSLLLAAKGINWSGSPTA